MTKTNVSKLNKKGLAFAAVVLLLAAALFVGAGAGDVPTGVTGTGTQNDPYVVSSFTDLKGTIATIQIASTIESLSQLTPTYIKFSDNWDGTAGTEQLQIGGTDGYKAVVIDGNGKTLTVRHEDKTSSKGAAVLIYGNVTLKNLTIDGPIDEVEKWVSNRHPLKVMTGNSTLEKVTIKNGSEAIIVGESGANNANKAHLNLKGKIHLEGSANNGIELVNGATLTLESGVEVTITSTVTDYNKEHAYIWDNIDYNVEPTIIDTEGHAKEFSHFHNGAFLTKYWVIDGSPVATITVDNTTYNFGSLTDAYYSFAMPDLKDKNDSTKVIAEAPLKNKNNLTIKVLRDSEGGGIGSDQDLANTYTIDFGGYTYTVDKPAVGSKGYETQAFRVLSGQDVTLKNGTITSTPNGGVKMLFNVYSNLKLQSMTLDGSHLPGSGRYVLSENSGTILIKDTTIVAKSGDYAFDVCKFNSYAEPHVTVEGNSVITGKIEYTLKDTMAEENAGSLTITNGTFIGEIVVGSNSKTSAASHLKVNGGSFTDPTVARYATNGSTINVKLMDNVTVGGIAVPSGTHLTLDFDNHILTTSKPAAGSAGTTNQAFQLLKGSTIVFKNGTIQIAETDKAEFKWVIRSYADLTLDNMKLDGSNLGKDDGAVLGTANGAVNITNGTSLIKSTSNTTSVALIAEWDGPNGEGGYPDGTKVTVNTTGEISGDIKFAPWNSSTVIGDSVLTSITIQNVKHAGTIVVDSKFDGGKEKIEISGGKYSVEPDAKYIKSGYCITGNPDSTYLYKVVKEHTVTFNADNGTTPTTVKVADGTTVTKPEDPKKDGFHFAGWLNGNELYNFATPVTSDLTLKAAWSEDKPDLFTVTFDTMGGSEAPAEQEVMEGGYVTKPADPTKTGAEFLGWFKGEVPYDFNTPVTADFTLVAHWKITEVPEDPAEIINEIKESGGDVVVKVTDETDVENVKTLVEQAQQNSETAGKVQLEVTSTNTGVIADVINDERIVDPVPVVVTKGNETNVKAVLDNVEDKSKVSLPVSGDGKNIETILEISSTEDYKEVKVQVPEVIIVAEPVTMTLGEAKTVTLAEIAAGATAGGSAEKLTLDLVGKDLNVQDAVSILGGDGVRGDLIKVDNEPLEVVVTTTPAEIPKEDGALTPEADAGISEISIVKMEGVSAAAVSKKNETTIEAEKPIEPKTPDVTRGYEEQKVHTVFQIVVPEEKKSSAVNVTFEVTLKEGQDPSTLSSFYLKHYNGTGWDEKQIPQSGKPVPSNGNTYKLTFTLKEFSPFALVSETAVPKSSSSSTGGSSTWLPSETTVPTAQPTVEPTQGVPTVKPTAQPIETPQAKSPAPFIGILAGLGAAAAVFGLRRK